MHISESIKLCKNLFKPLKDVFFHIHIYLALPHLFFLLLLSFTVVGINRCCITTVRPLPHLFWHSHCIVQKVYYPRYLPGTVSERGYWEEAGVKLCVAKLPRTRATEQRSLY